MQFSEIGGSRLASQSKRTTENLQSTTNSIDFRQDIQFNLQDNLRSDHDRPSEIALISSVDAAHVIRRQRASDEDEQHTEVKVGTG